MVEIKNLPNWITEDTWCENELENLLQDEGLTSGDRDAIETVLENM